MCVKKGPMRASSDPAAGFRLGSGAPHCLLLHGFTGSPAEMVYLAARLAQDGFSVAVPCLPGHGEDAGRDAESADWLTTARAAAAKLQPPICVAGLSMGALLALSLAAGRPDEIAALALLAPAVGLAEPGRTAARLARHPGFQRLLPRLPKIGGSDMRDPAARRWNPSGRSISTRGLAGLRSLSGEARAWAARVRCPTLVLLAGRDRTVDNDAARALAAAIPDCELRLLGESGHVIPLDVARGEAADRVIAHFRRRRGPA